MAKHTLHRYTDAQIKSFSKPGKYADGGGLFLSVKPDGSRSWLFAWTLSGKRKFMGLGRLKAHRRDAGLSLAEARDIAETHRNAVKDGLDPKEERNRKKLEQRGKPTFQDIATRYIRIHEPTWSNEKHRQQWRNTILGSDSINYCKAILPLPVDGVTRSHILEILQPIWLAKPETATRIRGRLENIFDYAEEEGHIERNPAVLRGNLKNSLPKYKKADLVKHHPAMPYQEVPGFVERLHQSKAMAAIAMEFIILNASRPGEAINALWSEIDFDNALWTVPAQRMKPRREHQVPLSERSMEILCRLQEIQMNDFVFFGQRPQRPISLGSLDRLKERMKIEGATNHGFRSAFRDWCGNETNFDRELAELALSHAAGNATERAYRRDTALMKRRQLMQAWSDYCQGIETGNVVALHG